MLLLPSPSGLQKRYVARGSAPTQRLISREVGYSESMSSSAPVVDPIRRPHLARVDAAFRAVIERDLKHCAELLEYLRNH